MLKQVLELRSPVTPSSCMTFIRKCTEISQQYEKYNLKVWHYIPHGVREWLCVRVKALAEWHPDCDEYEMGDLLSNKNIFRYLAEANQPKSTTEFITSLIQNRRFRSLPDGYVLSMYKFEQLFISLKTFVRFFKKLLFWLTT